MPLAHGSDRTVVSAPHLTSCGLFFASLTNLVLRGREQSPCLCPCRNVLAARGGRGQEAVSRGGPWPFRSQAPRFPLSFREGASSLPPSPPSLTPLPPFPDSEQESRSAKWSRLYPQGRVMGAPTQHSFCPVHLDTHCCPGLKGRQPRAVHKQPSQAQPEGKHGELAVSWAGARLAGVTQGSGHQPWDLQAPGREQRGKKGSAAP